MRTQDLAGIYGNQIISSRYEPERHLFYKKCRFSLDIIIISSMEMSLKDFWDWILCCKPYHFMFTIGLKDLGECNICHDCDHGMDDMSDVAV